jgi:hypothetical protein
MGLAHRSPGPLDLAEDGFHATLRAGSPIASHLRLLAAVGWTTFPDQDRIVPVLCPAPPAACSGGAQTIPGLGMVSLNLGLQPVVPVGGLDLRPSALVGGYWLYHRAAPLPATAVGTDAGLALGLPVGPRLRILLEGRWVHLFGRGDPAGTSRRVGVGVALR